jgi:hypothetical protein
MSMTIRAHYDGKVIVPDEPVELPIDQPLKVEVQPAYSESAVLADVEWHAALDRLAARAIHGLNIPDDALRRENLYEERD